DSLRFELRPFVSKIPSDPKMIGYAVRFGDKEPFLWEPLFSRKVMRILNSDSPEAVRALPIDFIVVDPSALATEHDRAIVYEKPSPRTKITTIEEWLKAYDAEIVARADVSTEPDAPPNKIYLTRLRR